MIKKKTPKAPAKKKAPKKKAASKKKAAPEKPAPKETPPVEKKGRGRPSKYDPALCEQIITWFNIDPYEVVKDRKVANPLPTFEKFAHSIGVHVDTLHEWKSAHPEFSEAYKKAQQLQMDFWRTNSLLGLFPPAFACFCGKNMFGWQDKQEVKTEMTGKDGGPVRLEWTVRFESKKDK